MNKAFKISIKFAVGITLCLAIASCANPAGGSGGGDTGGGSQIRLDFEGTQIATLSAASAFSGDISGVQGTWGGANAVSGDNDMTFAADTTTVAAGGTTSLKVSATARQNRYTTTQAMWAAVIDLTKVSGLTTPVNLTGKTLSLSALVPTGSTITGVKIIFNDSTGKASQGKVVAISSKDTWTTASYKYIDGTVGSDYTTAGFDITKVNSITVTANIDPASANAAASIVNFDSVSF